MSMFLFGDIVFRNQNVDIEEYAREILNAVTRNDVFIKFGGNVSRMYIRTAPINTFSLAYEITDSVVCNTADALLATEYCINYNGYSLLPWYERMSALKEFIVAGMTAEVAKIIMNVGVSTILEANEYSCSCKISSFISTMKRVFQCSKTVDPIGSIHIYPEAE